MQRGDGDIDTLLVQLQAWKLCPHPCIHTSLALYDLGLLAISLLFGCGHGSIYASENSKTISNDACSRVDQNAHLPSLYLHV